MCITPEASNGELDSLRVCQEVALVVTAWRLIVEADRESELAMKLLALLAANNYDAWLDPKVRVEYSGEDRGETRNEEGSDLRRVDRVPSESPHPSMRPRLMTPVELESMIKGSVVPSSSELYSEPSARTRNSGTKGSKASVGEEAEGYFETILELGKLEGELRLSLETMAERESEERVKIEEVRSLASQQARETFTCDVCGLQFLGMLAFAAHDEATTHLKNRNRRPVIDGRLVRDSAYRLLSGF